MCTIPRDNSIDSALQDYLEREIIPRYSNFDRAHRVDHVTMVMRQALELADYFPAVDRAMLLTAAAYHDLGLQYGREEHHIHSARIIRADENLRRWFTPEQIDIIADAAEDHRASAKQAPRTDYGRIISQSDRCLDADTVIVRALEYGLDNYPTASREEQIDRAADHVRRKYGRGGYVTVPIPMGEVAAQLDRLHRLIDDDAAFRAHVAHLLDNLTAAQ